MPLIRIRRKVDKVSDEVIRSIIDALPAVAAKALSCEDGGTLPPIDIMIEVDEVGPFDKHVKDLNIRVLAHDYPSRRGENLESLKARRRLIQDEVKKHLPEGVSYYVWPWLGTTSYGSDTEED